MDKAIPKAFKKKGGMAGIKAAKEAIQHTADIMRSYKNISKLAKSISDSYVSESTAGGIFTGPQTATSETFTKVKDAFTNPAFMEMIKAAGSITFKNGFPRDQDFVDSATKLSLSVENVGHVGKMIKEIDTIGVNLAKIKTFYTAITEIKNVVKEAGTIDEIKPFLGGGGTITVQHRHQNLSIDNITVNINAKQLAAEIMKAPKQTDGTFKGKRVAVRPAD